MTDFLIRVIIDPTPAVAGARKVKTALTGVQTKATALSKTMNAVFKFAGLSFGLIQIKRFGDSFLELQNRLRVAGFATDELAGATKRLIDISNRTRSPLDANARLLGRIGIAAKDLGASQEELFQFLELTGKGLAIQGSSAQEARGALTQLAQALGSGIVRAEEFNSVSEGAIPILQAISAAMGTTVSGLRKLVAAGKVTSKEFFQALLDGGEQLNKLFLEVAPTIGQAFTVLENQLIALTGTLETEFGGVLSATARAILVLANNLQIIVPLMIDFAFAVVAVKLAVFVSSIFAVLPAITSFNRAIRVASKVVPGLAAGMRLLNNVMKVNPFFLIISAIGLAITLMLQFGDAVKLTSDGSITLATAVQFVINVLSFLAGAVLQGIVAIFQTLGVILLVIGRGLITLAGQLFNVFAPLGPTLSAVIASLVILSAVVLGILSPVVLIGAAIAVVVIALVEFKDLIVETFPFMKDFFGFMNDALKIAVEAWKSLTSSVKDASKEFGLFEGAAKDVEKALKGAEAAAGSFGDAAKNAGDKGTGAFKPLSAAADQMAFDFASASNSASGSLNTLANNADSVASRIKASMSSAAASVASSGGGGGGGGGGGDPFRGTGLRGASGGLVGTGTGTSIKSGTGRGKVTIRSFTKEFAAEAQARGADIHVSVFGGSSGPAGGGSQGKITATFVDPERDAIRPGPFKPGALGGGGGPFTRAAAAALSRQVALALETEVLPENVELLIAKLSRAQGSLKLAENLDAIGQAKSRLGGDRGVNVILQKALQVQTLQRELDAILKPPAEALDSAAASLEVASANLSDIANAPIFLTGNPFEAFKQNVFGFAKGGTFEVPGSGGPDSKLVQLALTPGEQVDIKTKKQQNEDNDKPIVIQNVTFNIETPDADSFKRSQTQIVSKTLDTLASVGRRM